MAAVEVRVAGLLRMVDMVVPVRPVDAADAGTDVGLCAKKSVNFLFLSLRELFAGILEVAKCLEDG